MVAGGRELIDTLWNVNTKLIRRTLPPFGINRYIMECKCGTTTPSNVSSCELIDTLWNVNFFHLPPARDSSRINRYIMECKLLFCVFILFWSG